MATIKREIFSRGVRMTHQFEELLRNNDPMGVRTFEMEWPKQTTRHSGTARPNTAVMNGDNNYRPDSSPVSKPNGKMADFNGPTLDVQEVFARPIPVGTQRRLGPLKTDK